MDKVMVMVMDEEDGEKYMLVGQNASPRSSLMPVVAEYDGRPLWDLYIKKKITRCRKGALVLTKHQGDAERGGER